MRHPASRKWQKELRIFDKSKRTDYAKQNLALTTKELVQQSVRGNVSLPEHQRLNEPWHDLDNPNPIRVPTADLIDFAQYKADLKASLDDAVKGYHQAVNDLNKTKDALASAPLSATTSVQQ